MQKINDVIDPKKLALMQKVIEEMQEKTPEQLATDMERAVRKKLSEITEEYYRQKARNSISSI